MQRTDTDKPCNGKPHNDIRADRRRGHFVSRFPRVQSTRPYGADAKRRETLMRSIARLGRIRVRARNAGKWQLYTGNRKR